MKKFLSRIALGAMALLMLAGTVHAEELLLVPQPLSTVLSGGVFKVTAKTPLIVESGDENPARIFAEQMMPLFGQKKPMTITTRGEGIRLSIDPTLATEGYRMVTSKKGIHISGGTEAGIFYGLQSLRQLIHTYEGRIPCGEILDAPNFAYRGAHFDVCRHFFTVEEVKRYIDILAAHKLNRLHWHLTDDQGWRIEIKAYPELTEKGSMRKETLIGHCHRPEGFDGIPYGGYYTQEQIREVVDYAAKRYITIVPEIEMPGHAQAALHALPWLGCQEQKVDVWSMWGVTPEVMCGGKETTYEFLETVLSEVIELFPSKWIHIGGDECPKERWKVCEHCQARMEALGLESENQLQGYLIERIEKFLNGYGRRLIGWDEILECGVTPTATVMSWRGTEGGITAAKRGNQVVMTPMEPCYFDFYQTKSQEGEGLQIGGHVSFEKVYAWDPYKGLNEAEKKYILGVQCNLWTEYILDFETVEKKLLPRLAALSEVQWATERRNEATIRPRMEQLRKFYEAYDWNYAPYYFEGRE